MSEVFTYEPRHDPDSGITDAQKRNLERLNFREYLEKLKLVKDKEVITDEEFKRVHQIAYLGLVKEEDVVPLAALDFVINRLREDGYSSADIYEDVKGELLGLVSQHLNGKDGENKDLLFSIVTTSIADSKENKNFIEILFRKIEERNKITSQG